MHRRAWRTWQWRRWSPGPTTRPWRRPAGPGDHPVPSADRHPPKPEATECDDILFEYPADQGAGEKARGGERRGLRNEDPDIRVETRSELDDVVVPVAVGDRDPVAVGGEANEDRIVQQPAVIVDNRNVVELVVPHR
ncbi:MAG: hypothetical protein OXF56_16570 [Rhodobacteraceae bacterium]|nr:hypothetical protein [Paracoccaceae bacterium]